MIYGIIKVGFIEFHIIDEKFNGVSYRPDISFPKKDFKGVKMPWVYKNRQISLVEEKLNAKNIAYKRYVVSKPENTFETAAGTFIGLSDEDHHFIDTVGGVLLHLIIMRKQNNWKHGKFANTTISRKIIPNNYLVSIHN